MAALIFWRPFQDSCRVAMVEPPVSYLEPHGPRPLPARKGVSIGTAGCACLGFVVRYLFDYRLPSCTISAGLPLSESRGFVVPRHGYLLAGSVGLTKISSRGW